MPKLTLIRGLPGSGKSTMANVIVNSVDTRQPYHFETDMYFTYNGRYLFDPKRLKEAHQWCQDETKAALDMGYDVIVSNTFTQRWEMQPYLDMGYETEILTARGNYGNVHNVPPEAIERMRARWEE